jgi:hypothetical protein
MQFLGSFLNFFLLLIFLSDQRDPRPAEALFFYYWWGGTKSLSTAATSGLLYKPQMIKEDDCGAIGGMKIGRGNRSTRRKPAPAPHCPPQIPHGQTRARTPGRRGGKPATNRLSYRSPLHMLVNECFKRIFILRTIL